MSGVIEGRQAVEAALKRGPLRGYVLQAEPRFTVGGKEYGGNIRLVPWQKAAKRPLYPGASEVWNPDLANAAVPEAALRQMMESLPVERRRTPRERKRVLVSRLIEDVRRAHMHQVTPFPASIADDIRQAGWVAGKPDLLAACSRGEQWAISIYADHLMLQAAGQQKEQDAHKTTLDWHGFDNASITVGKLAYRR